MTAVKFDISEHEEVGKYLGVSIEKVAGRALQSTGLRIVQKITAVVIPGEPRPPIDRRVYAAGWRARKLPDGTMVENTVPYAGIVEDGARAGHVKIGRRMIDALAEWVLRKGMAGKAGRGEQAKAERLAEARRIAWAVAMAMKKNGIFGGKGLKILNKGLKDLGSTFKDELRREIDREW